MNLTSIKKEYQEEMISMFWVLMRTVESNADCTGHILDKRDVECAYETWNKVTGDNKKPVWEERKDG